MKPRLYWTPDRLARLRRELSAHGSNHKAAHELGVSVASVKRALVVYGRDALTVESVPASDYLAPQTAILVGADTGSGAADLVAAARAAWQ